MALKQIKEAYLGIISRAIEEDIAKGDITSLALFTDEQFIKAKIVANENAVFCGKSAVILTYGLISPKVKVNPLVSDGESVVKGQDLVVISGPVRSVLSGERIVLNFISRLSGIASITKQYVDLAGGKFFICDTRKTVPGWRVLEKYAVKCGGGRNHRMGLFDQILIKDNHIEAIKEAMGVSEEEALVEAVRRARTFKKQNKLKVKIEVEVETLASLRVVLAEKPDIIMLDNMSYKQMKEAVALIRKKSPKTKIEVSGNITLKRVSKLLDLEIDYVSIGALTHSVKAVDVSMEISSKV